MSSFVHLAAQSWCSLGHGVVSPYELTAQAVAEKMPALGVADTDGFAGAVRLAKACSQAGISYVPGVDLALGGEAGPGWRPALADRHFRSTAIGQPFLDQGAARVTFLAMTNAGFGRLCQLSSAAYGYYQGLPAHNGRDRRQPAIHTSDIEHHLAGHPDVVALMGPSSPFIRLLDTDQIDLAHKELRRWMHWLGPDQLLIGLTHHGQPCDDRRIRSACILGDRLGIRVVVNQIPRFISRDDGQVADLVEAIAQQVRVGASTPKRPPLGGWWQPQEEIIATFHERPDALYNTLVVAEQVEVDLGLGQSRVPHFGHWDETPSGSAHLQLRQLSMSGIIERLGIDPARFPDHQVSRRLEEELALIIDRGLASYFLTVAEIVHRIRDKRILVACRGSAAGSLVAYALRISDVNPIDYGLLMERFLHHYRTDLPDIDIDVESHRREEIQRDLIERWGPDRVTGLAMVTTFRSRGAIRETGKALGLSLSDIDLVAKAFPRTNAARITDLASNLPEVQGLGFEAPHIQRVLHLAQRLAGIPRHLALHPCGLVLADTTLGTLAPLLPSGPREDGDAIAMVPYDKDDIEDLGLVKLDVLGVRMFSAMAHAINLTAQTRNHVIDVDAIDRERDDATFAMIQRSDTIGMFQIESPGQRELIGRISPQDTHDLVIDISLFRPGPVKGDMIEPFLRRRKGEEPVDLPPILRPILAETFGVIVYHEQVIRCISAITGCDLGQADVARRNLGNAYALPDMERWIRTWCARRGFAQSVTDWLWHSLAQFASFGFCKAHAAAFSVPTYRSAWMKANIMPEFLAGVLTHDPGMYPARLILAEARRHGIIVLGVSINSSGPTYSVIPVADPFTPGATFVDGDYGQAPPDTDGNSQRWAIRPSLTCVRGIDQGQIDSILNAQPFTSLADLYERTHLHAPVAMDLARIGALDELAPEISRGDVRLAVEEYWTNRQQRQRPPADEPVQLHLFHEAGPPLGLPAISPAQQIRAEVEVTGMDLSSHIITFYAKREGGITQSAHLHQIPTGQRVRVIGAKVATQTPPIKTGKRIIFLTLDDGSGLADITFFPRAHAQCARTVFTHWLLVVEGRVHRRGSLPTIIGERAWPLSTRQASSQLWHASAGSTG